MGIAQTSAKARLEVRLSPELKQAATAAAALANCDVTALVARGLAREIEEVKSQFGTIWLDDDRFENFLTLAREAKPVSPKLRKAALSLDEEGFDFERVRAIKHEQTQQG